MVFSFRSSFKITRRSSRLGNVWEPKTIFLLENTGPLQIRTTSAILGKQISSVTRLLLSCDTKNIKTQNFTVLVPSCIIWNGEKCFKLHPLNVCVVMIYIEYDITFPFLTVRITRYVFDTWGLHLNLQQRLRRWGQTSIPNSFIFSFQCFKGILSRYRHFSSKSIQRKRVHVSH